MVIYCSFSETNRANLHAVIMRISRPVPLLSTPRAVRCAFCTCTLCTRAARDCAVRHDGLLVTPRRFVAVMMGMLQPATSAVSAPSTPCTYCRPGCTHALAPAVPADAPGPDAVMLTDAARNPSRETRPLRNWCSTWRRSDTLVPSRTIEQAIETCTGLFHSMHRVARMLRRRSVSSFHSPRRL